MHVDSPGMLWIKLRSAFERAYEEPINEDLIARIYAFADWCVAQVDEPDLDFHLPTIVCTHFYEHIPELKPAREDIPRWFSMADVLSSREMFSYMVGEEGFQEILKVFDEFNKRANRSR